MNNSFANETDIPTPDRSERIGRLTTLIESANAVLDSKEWSTLKTEEFDGALLRYKRLLLSEARKKTIDEPEIYRLQGRIDVMERFDLSHMRDKWLNELETIKKLN